ncbi:AAA family ATPase [Alkalihalobacillus sp. CinArs1]|uniref:AAA family ATPase n=1 Tax=Alkalihalobacillus sp. CinArs1 TaxID=2995314 RepID=UPI0022DCF7DF|nr:AAA family ATPase [Alkalihalobacillus sp. CinArs1]
MGVKNYLIEGVSCTGKTTVCNELQRRGYHAIHGDRELAYQGDPKTGERTDTAAHENHIWDIDRLKALIENKDEEATFFCGGSRNFMKFIDLFDEVFVLEVDSITLKKRLLERSEQEFGGKKAERELIMRLHSTKEDIPKNGVMINATASIEHVVDVIVRQCEETKG